MNKTNSFISPLLIFFFLLCSHQVNAVTLFPDRIRLLELLKTKQFSSLNELISTHQLNYERGKEGEKIVHYTLETFSNSDPELDYLIREWINIYPDSYIPYLVRAYYYYGIAWSWRGHNARDETSPLRIKMMNEYLKYAARDLSRVVNINNRLSAAYALAIRVVMLTGSEEMKQQVLREGLADNPVSYLIRASYLWSLKPKWGGTAKELSQFYRDKISYYQGNAVFQGLAGYIDYIFAESLMDKERYSEASIQFDFAVAKGADHIIYRERGVNSFKLKKYESALNDFNKSLELWPQNVKVLRWRALTLRRLGKEQEAQQDIDAAFQFAPYNKQLLLVHASIHHAIGNQDNVLRDYNNLLVYNSDEAEIWFNRGMFNYKVLKDYSSAVADLRQATLRAPEKAHYWYQFAAILHFNNDCDIVQPLDEYLNLCASGSKCIDAELEWSLKARNWLDETGRCHG